MTKKAPFKLVVYGSIPTALFIIGPDGLDIAVSYEPEEDDLKIVRRNTKKMVRLLNKHWRGDEH